MRAGRTGTFAVRDSSREGGMKEEKMGAMLSEVNLRSYQTDRLIMVWGCCTSVPKANTLVIVLGIVCSELC